MGAPEKVPESSNVTPLASRNAPTEIEKTRAIAETMGAIEVARRFPRDQKSAIDRIIQACTRPTLAEAALYSYARGGTEITGPSIRMAEAIAQNWGNIQFGVRELEQRNGESTVEAYAWDVETNTRSSKTFQVPHKRYTRERTVALTDPRDIYELVANNGARRLRACILSVIPGDIVEMAVNQVETTLRTKVQISPELLQSTLEKFGEFGVTKAMIEARIQRRFDAVTPAQIVQLGKLYNSIKDGMAQVSDFFETPKPDRGGTATQQLKEELKRRSDAEIAAQAAAAKEVPAAAPAVDDATVKATLRSQIAEAWKDWKPAQRSEIVAGYGKKTLLDLNQTQLTEILAKITGGDGQ